VDADRHAGEQRLGRDSTWGAIVMTPSRRKGRRALGFESLEGRALLSGIASETTHRAAAAILARLEVPKLGGSSAGAGAILNAILGGAGHEFVVLAEKEVHNIFAVAAEFSSGTHQVTVPGLVVKTPNWQSQFTAFKHDVLSLNVGGAILLKGKKIELAAIARGPYTTSPFTNQVVFAINRGAGARLGPLFPERPAITPDALVTVTIGPDGQNNSATITDLTTGITVPVNPDVIRVAGPTVRVLVPAVQLPSEGFAVKHYKFAVFAQLAPTTDFSLIGSFVPESTMIPIGVLTNVSPTL
jgi:hypothetical protein